LPRLAFLGAARSVTGSQYLLDAGGERILVDSGLFQGDKTFRQRNWTEPPFDPRTVSHLVLTHTHLDHIGRLPRLVRQGFRGTIWATPPTKDLAEVLLLDAAHLQQEDADYLNRKNLTSHEPALPLFDAADVQQTMPLFRSHLPGETREISPAFSFTYREAGHLLGAASVELDVRENGRTTRVLFSGDVGRYGSVLVKDPAPATNADYVLAESTYGNRAHPAIPVQEQLEGVLVRTFARGGVVLVPAFAVGRAQQMIWLMDDLVTRGRLRPFPIHLDSPMAVDATRIYAQYPEAGRVSLNGVGGRSLLYGKWVHLHRTQAESMALNSVKGPAVIISSSGMLTGGRILHHCRVRLPHAENTLLITGYQAENTLGRALLDGVRTVRIHKGEVAVLAEIASLKGMSGHADASEMVRWLSAIDRPPRTVFLTHGEVDAAEALAARITKERGFPTYVPDLGETVELLPGAAS
jgi:metallo-beta-lactamase family protein